MPGRNDKEFAVRVTADLRQAKEKFSSFEKELVRLELAGRKAGSGLNHTQKELKETEAAADKAGREVSVFQRGLRAMAAAALAYISIGVAADLAKTADEFNILQDRIRTATREFGDYNTASRELFEISQRNGTALEATVELFQRLARSAPSLEATQDEVLAVTNAVSQLGVISGATNEQLKFGLLQLGQAFSYPIVQAEEINSVLENIPEVARRIEKGLGLMPGTLKQTVNEGRILGKDIFNAILSQTREINEEFQDIPSRLSRSSQRFKTAMASVLSDLDKTYGITRLLASALDAISNRIAPVGEDNSFLGQLNTEQLNQQLETTKSRLEEIDRLNRMNLSQAILIPEDRLKTQQDLLKLQASLMKEIQRRASEAEAEGSKNKQQSPLTEEQKRAEAAINKTVEALELQAATLGKTRSEAVLYELELKGMVDGVQLLTDADRERAKVALDAIDAHEKMVETQKRVKEIIESTRTPAEQLAAAVKELSDLYNAGAFGAKDSAEATETLRRAIEKARKDILDLGDDGDKTFDRLQAAVRGWGDEFTDTLVDMAVSGKSTFRDLANAIIRDLVRIAIQKSIVDPLIPGLDSFFSGIFNSSGGTSASVQHGGGMAGSGPRRSVSPLAFLNAPRFHNGTSFVGLRPDEHRAILQTGERVLSREDNKLFSAGLAMGGGGGAPMELKVELHNEGTPQQATSMQGRFEGDQFVVSVVTQDLARGGSISQTLQRTFKLQRNSGG